MLKLLNNKQQQQNNYNYVNCEKQITTYNVDGHVFLLDSNNLNVWETNDDIVKILDQKSIASDRVPYCEYDSHIIQHKGYIIFQATYACNLKCRYCFVEHHYADHTNSIDLDTAKKALDIYQADWRRQGHNVGFFGGEPLLNWEFIYNLVQYINKKIDDENKVIAEHNNKNEKEKRNPVFARWHITTNATLLTEEIAEFLAKNGFSLIVSIEGDEETHNESRPYRNGLQNSFADTMRGLKFLKAAYNKYGKKLNTLVTLRSTFDRHGVDLVKRLEFLNKLCDDGFGGHVSVEPACLSESCASSTMDDLTREELRAQFLCEYIKAAKWYANRKKNGQFASFHHVESFIDRLENHKFAWTECGAGKGYLSVGPFGKVCACHREHESALGTIGKIDRIKQEAWLDNRLYARAKCPECQIRYICGGGCRCNSALILHNLKMPTTAECAFREMQIEMGMLAMSLMQDESFTTTTKPQEKKEAKCSCPECTEKKVLSKTESKIMPICGLDYCLDSKCPFSKCGKQSPEDLEKAKTKIRELACQQNQK